MDVTYGGDTPLAQWQLSRYVLQCHVFFFWVSTAVQRGVWFFRTASVQFFFRCLLDPCLFPQFVVQCKLEFTLVLLC